MLVGLTKNVEVFFINISELFDIIIFNQITLFVKLKDNAGKKFCKVKSSFDSRRAETFRHHNFQAT